MFKSVALLPVLFGLYSPYVYDEVVTIKTPNGSDVIVGHCTQNIDRYIGAENNGFDTEFPLAKVIQDSNPAYNCFSYAFYDTSPENRYVFLDKIDNYWKDGSYVASNGYVGDRIVYFDREGNHIHAGIIIARTSWPMLEGEDDLSIILVNSKWGVGAVYQHQGNYNPYSHIYNVNYGSFAYYKENTNHNHRYDNKIVENNENHVCFCTCGDLLEQPRFYYETDGIRKCVYCNHVEEVARLNMEDSIFFGNSTLFANDRFYLSGKDYSLIKERSIFGE